MDTLASNQSSLIDLMPVHSSNLPNVGNQSVSSSDIQDWDQFLRRIVRRNVRFSDGTFYSLVTTYVVLITFGTLANLAIIVAVVRQRKMRLLRHLLIVNLAFSDVLLCLLTMPLTLMELVTFSWPLGKCQVLCQLTGSLEAVSIFVSTLTIAAIAVDRYNLIVYPTCPALQQISAALLLVIIWILGTCLSAPLFVFRKLIRLQDIPESLRKVYAIDYIDFCIQEWPTDYASAIYSIAATLLQYIAPMAVLGFAHAGICRKLRNRMRRSGGTAPQTTLCTPVSSMTHTSRLLSAIALTFALCWMPLNVFNLADAFIPFGGSDQDTTRIIYAVVHLIGMSSACINPLLYGWLNSKLRHEIMALMRCTTTNSMAVTTTAVSRSQRPCSAV